MAMGAKKSIVFLLHEELWIF